MGGGGAFFKPDAFLNSARDDKRGAMKLLKTSFFNREIPRLASHGSVSNHPFVYLQRSIIVDPRAALSG